MSEVDAQVAILRRCSSSEPACACGLLVWTRRNLTTPQFSGARFNGTFLPAMLQLVGSIAEAHPGLQGEVCDLVHAILIHEPGKEAEDVSAETADTLRRRLLECLLWLLTRGCVFPVLAKLHADDDGVRALIDSGYGGMKKVRRDILCDFFRSAFDGSGADNNYDAGSCIDGRLTSAWNWCSRLSKKNYSHLFKMTGFVGFDGDFSK